MMLLVTRECKNKLSWEKMKKYKIYKVEKKWNLTSVKKKISDPTLRDGGGDMFLGYFGIRLGRSA